MQELLSAVQAAIGEWPTADLVRDIVWVKALAESVHIMGMGFVLFSVGAINIRLTGLSGGSGATADTVRRFSPWIWGALLIVLLSGLFLLTGAGSRRGLPSPVMQLKILLLSASILSTCVLLFTVKSDPDFWERDAVRRVGAKVIAPICFGLWAATVCAGRWLAYPYVLFPDF